MHPTRSESLKLHRLLARLSQEGPSSKSRSRDLEDMYSILFEGRGASVRRCIRTYFGQRPGYARLVRRVFDEADLVSEGRDALMRALDRGAYRGDRCHPWGFVWKVVVRRMRDIALKERRRQGGRVSATETFDPLDSVITGEDSALDRLVQGERRAAVARLLSSVTDEERHLLLARYGWGMSYADLAYSASTATTAGAMRVRLHRLRGKLRERAVNDRVLCTMASHGTHLPVHGGGALVSSA